MLNGVARSMAPGGLKKALSFEAVRLASQERVQQGHFLERRFGEGPNLAAHRGPDCAGDGGQLEEVPKMMSHSDSSDGLPSRPSTFQLLSSRSEFL